MIGKIVITKVNCNEKSLFHMNNVKSFISLQYESGRIDQEFAKQLTDEVNYWNTVLTCVMEIIKFLALRGLVFTGN